MYHLDLGKLGEKTALNHLLKKGYDILEQNWRWRKAEIDIIARKKGELIFIEVKTRNSLKSGDPGLSISPRKRQLMIDAATRYMEKIGHEWAIRFDVISIIIQNEQVVQIDHYLDSFSPWE